MEQYLIYVIILLALGIMGLVVGVANDAVNFTNSAIGSKTAPRKIIILIAGLGILTGVTFSSGMMEVARKGIFDPNMFLLNDIILIFLAVMIQNILLLDLYNTFGLPTSTTVSMVFGLLGGALGVSFIKVLEAGGVATLVFNYIDTANVFKIISGIFLSIVFAFVFGVIVQYFSRLIFTFDYKKRLKYYGSTWGGAALTFITYFILIKGAKGASFLSEEQIKWIATHTQTVLLSSFGFWVVTLQLLLWFTRVNILKLIVLVGTFALAMAFAANDLVNFIGAPIAGLEAYKIALKSAEPFTQTMAGLKEKIPANTLILLISGLIMVATLYLSKKARTVTKTELSLGRQDEGFERFESNALARAIVRMVIVVFGFIKKITPESFRKKIAARFDVTDFKPEPDKKGEMPSFDLIRASVNLMVASALISFATSLKLPLSTTYVTFIVAMSTALPDQAWGRESAVYRVSGVITVVGGWLFTALIAALTAAIIAALLYYGDIFAVIAFLGLSVFLIFRTARLHKKRESEFALQESKATVSAKTPESELENIFIEISDYLTKIIEIVNTCFKGVLKQNLNHLRKANRETKNIKKYSNTLVNDILKLTRYAKDEQLEAGFIYANAITAVSDISNHLNSLTSKNYSYFDNNHNKFIDSQTEELKQVNKFLEETLGLAAQAIKIKKFATVAEVNKKTEDYKDKINKFNKNQLKRIKKSLANIRRSRLFLDNLSDLCAMMDNANTICCACKDIHESLKGNADSSIQKKI